MIIVKPIKHTRAHALDYITQTEAASERNESPPAQQTKKHLCTRCASRTEQILVAIVDICEIILQRSLKTLNSKLLKRLTVFVTFFFLFILYEREYFFCLQIDIDEHGRRHFG